MILDLTTGQVVRRLDGLSDEVNTLAFSPDDKALAWGSGSAPTIHLLELATGKERYRLASQSGGILSPAFSANGSKLISGKGDTTVLIWDLTGKLAAGGSWDKPLSEAALEASWSNLAGDDAPSAYQAIRRLAASPKDAIPYLRMRLHAVGHVEGKRLTKLIADLDSNQFAVRESAEKKLEKLGEVAAPACRQALEQRPSPEVRRRLEALLEKQRLESLNPSSDHLRTLRAIEVLERIATPDARQILASLANGAPEARLTQEAKASMDRLAKRIGAARP